MSGTNLETDAVNVGVGERLLRIQEVVWKTGMSAPTIYRRMQDGSFPRPVQVSGNIVAWVMSEVDDWMARLPRRATVAN